MRAHTLESLSASAKGTKHTLYDGPCMCLITNEAPGLSVIPVLEWRV